ncbi:MAG: hypothetical protein CR968_01790 [Flavobacteriia bacterium]|nr:MAG: hypothetical protein CR968_01790 [Flavobacteriia bacterium]
MGTNGLLQGGMLKTSVIFFIIGTFIILIVSDIRKLFTKDKKKAIIYILIVLATFALIGLLSYSKVLNNSVLGNYIGFQVLFLIIGGVHLWVMRTFFKDLSKKKSGFFNEFFFTLAILIIGLIAFFNVTKIFKPSYSFVFLSSSLTFMIPVLFYKMYEFALLIPVKVYKQWLYPVEQNIKDPTAEELKNPLVISFEFTKKGLSDEEITNFRVKAPENLEFSKLFYFFLNDYNERHPENEIEYLNDDRTPQKWVFYRKATFFRPIKYINFSKTVIANNLREDDVVICVRT